MSDKRITQEEAFEIARRFVENYEANRKKRGSGTRSGKLDFTYIFEKITSNADEWIVYFQITAPGVSFDPSDRMVFVNKKTGEMGFVYQL